MAKQIVQWRKHLVSSRWDFLWTGIVEFMILEYLYFVLIILTLISKLKYKFKFLFSR